MRVRYFRAVFRAMPAFAAAIVNVFSFFRNFISLLICWFVTMLPMVQISSEKTGNSNCRRGKFYSSLITRFSFSGFAWMLSGWHC